MSAAAEKIASQTYRIGERVVFKTGHGVWKMGVPLFADAPLDGFVAGTVTLHSTLKAARRVALVEQHRRPAQ